MNNMIEKLEEILNTKDDIRSAIESKGQQVGDAPLKDYPEKIRNIESLGDGSIYALLEDVGLNEDLSTINKDTIVGAINELKLELEQVTSITDPDGILESLESKANKVDIGELSELTTHYKENLVASINELKALLDNIKNEDLVNIEIELNGKTNSEDLDILLAEIEAIKADKSSLGSLSELTTTQKNNLVAAINEVNSKVGDVDLSEVFTLLEGKVDQAIFDTFIAGMQADIDGKVDEVILDAHVATLQQSIRDIELTPGPQGPPGQDGQPGQPGADGLDGQDGKSAYQIWLDAGNSGTEQDFLTSLEGPQGPPGAGGVDQEFIDTVENNEFRVNFIWGKSTDWSYFFTNQDLETTDFSNMILPGFFYRDNWTQGIKYNLSRMFASAKFGTPPPGAPFEWEWDPDIPDSNFWKWYMNFETWMEIMPSSIEYMFANATGDVIMLPALMIDEPLSARGMFSGAKVNKIDLGHGFGDRINDMSNMFSWTSNSGGGPTEADLSRLITMEVTNMESMFELSKFTTLDLSSFDTSSVTNMSRMFMNTEAATINLSSFDTSNVTDAEWMFRDTKIPTLDLSSFNTSLLTSMSGMFYNCKATNINLSSFNTSNVTDISSMFLGSQAATLDLSSFDTSNVTSMYGMFNGSQATTLNLSSFDTSNVTEMGWMFAKSKATILDLSSFDTSNVTSMVRMFWQSKATTGYARTQADADRFNASSDKPSGLTFVVHPDLV